MASYRIPPHEVEAHTPGLVDGLGTALPAQQKQLSRALREAETAAKQMAAKKEWVASLESLVAETQNRHPQPTPI